MIGWEIFSEKFWTSGIHFLPSFQLNGIYFHGPLQNIFTFYSIWRKERKGTAKGKLISKNKLSYLCDLFLGVCLVYNVAKKSFLYSLSIHYVMIKNMEHIMNNTDCCPIYPNSEAVNGGFSPEKKACFEVLDFLKDYQRFFVCFYWISVDHRIPTRWFCENYRHV